MDEIHLGDIGTILRCTFYDGEDIVDISGTTTKQIKLRKPSGAVVTKDGVFVTDGTDGKLQYTTIADDLDEIGIWHLQGYLVMNEGSWHSNKVIFRVSDVVS